MGAKVLVFLFNSKCHGIVDLRKQWHAVSVCHKRGTTQIMVKVPKSWLSVNGTKVSIVIDREEVGLEAATL